jgi:hypothetical protein
VLSASILDRLNWRSAEWFVYTAALLLLIACQDTSAKRNPEVRAEKTDESYFPVPGGGDRWEYADEQGEAGSVVRYEGEETIQGTHYLKRATAYSGLPEYPSTREYVRYTPKGIYALGTGKSTPERLWWPLPMEVGDTWSIGIGGDPNKRLQFTVEANEAAVLPDRTYEDCLKVVARAEGVPESEYHEVYYLAPGIGPVRHVIKYDGGQRTFSAVLTQYVKSK